MDGFVTELNWIDLCGITLVKNIYNKFAVMQCFWFL